MPKSKPQDYQPISEYVTAASAIRAVIVMILFDFAREECTTRDVIIRNSMARTAQTLEAILRLWDIADYQGCFVLYRCLLDRLFLLDELHHKDEFEVFEKWSFVKQCEYQNRARSEMGATDLSSLVGFCRSVAESTRLAELMREQPQWSRPKAADIAKRMNLVPLYKFGYDHASMHVHPMANDGAQDFYTLTKLEPAPPFPDWRSVLHNALLVSLVLVANSLKASNLSPRSVLNDFLDDMMRFLETGARDYQQRFEKLAVLFRDSVGVCGIPPVDSRP